MKTAGSVSFSRLIILRNPEATNAPKVQRLIDTLETAYPGKMVIDDTQPTVTGNAATLKRHLRLGDILLPCGGDGTLSMVVSALLDPSMPKTLRSTPVLPVGTGKMNDVARMLNGKHFNDPLYVLQHGRTVPVYPLSYTIAADGDTTERLGMYNIGFGSIGLGTALYYNEPEFRARQKKRPALVQDLVAAGMFAKTWSRATTFDVTYKGTRQKMLDLFFSSGNRMAGYWRFPARLTKKEFFIGIVPEKNIPRVTKTTIGLFTNRFEHGEVVDKPVSFFLHEPVHAEIDGEHFTTPGPSAVKISFHKEPVTMLATSSKA